MKFLLIFFFAGFFLADTTEIEKYKLSLVPGETNFQGTVTLTLSDPDNSEDFVLDDYIYTVTKCTYTGRTESPPTTTPKPDPTTTPKPDPTTTPKPDPTTTPKPDPTNNLKADPTAAPQTDPTAASTPDTPITPQTDPTAASTPNTPITPQTDPTAASTPDTPITPQTDPTTASTPDTPTTPQTDPTAAPTPDPTATPKPDPTATPKPDPTATPKPDPTAAPTPDPTATPKPDPTATPKPDPTATPKPDPTATPKPDPTATPKPDPTATPKPDPTTTPTPDPTTTPKPDPTTTPKPDPTTTPKPDPTTPPPKVQNCSFNGTTIHFNGLRTGKEVILEFEGSYSPDGLTNYTTESNGRLYVADMTKPHHRIIFPCRETEKAKFEFEGDNVVMSNLENLRRKDKDEKVSLRDIVFVQGDIVKENTSMPSFQYYRMNSSEKMGTKLENVMRKVVGLYANLQVLFAPVSQEISTNARDLIILSHDLKSDDSKSDFEDIVEKLAQKLFKKSPNEKETFLDVAGPTFTKIKILGGDTTEEERRRSWQFVGLEEDGFKNSSSLDKLASEYGILENPVLLSKGISVLYSLDSICGNEKFMTGLTNYIKDGNPTAEEAFKGCFDGDKSKSEQFFKAWVNDPGYPVVHVISKNGQYNMDQEKFLWFGSEEKSRRWILPVDYKIKNGSGGRITLPSDKGSVPLGINSTNFILDHNHKGFYRVNYDAKVWEALITELKSNSTWIDPYSRMKLIDDVFSFPKSTYNFSHGTPDYVTALELSAYLKKENDFFALQTAFKAFEFLDSALNSQYQGKFRNHVRDILREIYKKINVKPASDEYYETLTIRVYDLACKFGVEECIKNAMETFEKIKSGPTNVSELEKIAICSAVRNDTTKWMDAYLLFSTSMLPSEKLRFLTCTRDKTILSLYLSQFISQNDENGFTNAVIDAVDHNPENTKVILDITKRFSNTTKDIWGNEHLEKIVKFILPKLSSESTTTLKEIAKDLDGTIKHEVDEVCEHVDLWTKTKAKSVEKYFKGSGSQAKPALVLLVTTLIPLANHIFNN